MKITSAFYKLPPPPPHLFGVHMRNIITRKYQSQTCCRNRAILSPAITYNLHGFCRNSGTDHNADADSHPRNANP